MRKIKFFLQQSWLLIVASFVFGLMIAIASAAWSSRVEQNKIDKLNNLMRGLITEANTFEIAIEAVEVSDEKNRTARTTVYRAVGSSGKTVGFAFIASGTGFADKIELVVAIDAQCRNLLGFRVLSSSETPGFGDKIKQDFFGSQFVNAPAEQLELVKIGNPRQIDNKIVAISGATVTSTAVVKMFNAYVGVVKEQLISKGLITDGR